MHCTEQKVTCKLDSTKVYGRLPANREIRKGRVEGCESKNKTEDPTENRQNFGQTHYQEVTREVGNVLSLQGNADRSAASSQYSQGTLAWLKQRKLIASSVDKESRATGTLSQQEGKGAKVAIC